jgi:hypothetical protein
MNSSTCRGAKANSSAVLELGIDLVMDEGHILHVPQHQLLNLQGGGGK